MVFAISVVCAQAGADEPTVAPATTIPAASPAATPVAQATTSATLEPSRPMDGTWITLGPGGAITHIAGGWHPGAGAELSVIRVRRHQWLGGFGVDGGGVAYSDRAGGRLWLEAEIAVDALPGPTIGFAIGPAAEVNAEDPPRFGAQATIWLVTGVVPYVRIGSVPVSGDFIEVGILVKLPALKI